ncbi:MAG: ABC transporter permease [Mycobacteriales bacterium]|nr:ABC transporter permease [Mycobacteriales bacterium]
MTSVQSIVRTVVPHPRLRWTLGLIGVLARKNFQTRFKRSYFGVALIALQPMVQALVYSIVFLKIFKVTRVEHYPLYILSGVMPWALITAGILGATTSVVENSSLVRKIDVPRMVFPLAAIGGACLAFVVPLAILLVAGGVTGTLGVNTLWVLLALPLQLVLIAAVGILACGLHVAYRDVRYVLDAALLLLFYSVPVLYVMEIVPEGGRDLVRANPFTGVLSLWRAAILDRPLDGRAVTISLVVAPLLLTLGAWSFQRRSRNFADLV